MLEVRLADPADHEKIGALLYADGKVTDFETDVRRRDGSPLRMLVSCILISLEGRAMVLSICKDISEQRALEARLGAERRALEGTLASLGDAVITVDPAHRVIVLNQEAERLTGWNALAAAWNPNEMVCFPFTQFALSWNT